MIFGGSLRFRGNGEERESPKKKELLPLLQMPNLFRLILILRF
jgi:hypothetical protein